MATRRLRRAATAGLSAAALLLSGLVSGGAAAAGIDRTGVQRVPAGGPPPHGSGDVRVEGYVRTIDGDTIEPLIGGNRVGVGLIGIDAPSGNTRCGAAAAGALGELVAGGVDLREGRGFAFDERERRLYYGYTPDGRSLARVLVKRGFARPTGEGHETDALRRLARRARRAERGCLWAARGERSPVRRAAALAQPERPEEGYPGNTVFAGPFTFDRVARGLVNPTSFAPLPDGRVLIAQQDGIVRVLKNGSLLPAPFLDLSARVNDYWDRGLLAIAPDPAFASNGYVYVLYTYENDPAGYEGPKVAVLSRLTASGDTASPATERILVGGGGIGAGSCNLLPKGADCIPADSLSHAGGGIRFAPDGTMFVTLGDGASFNTVNTDALRAQDLDLLAGKMLRVTTTGQGVAGNPFFTGDPTANRSKVWAYGMRNPYRFTLRPGTSVPYLGDVGWSTWEEIDVARAGANLGWPCYEGTARQAGYEPKSVCQALYQRGPSAVVAPLTEWNHGGRSAAATGGAFYTGTSYPAEYRGAYFYGDYANSFLRYLQPSSSDGVASGPSSFATDAGNPVDIQMGPDGNLWYLAIGPGELRRIRYTGGCPAGEYSAEYFAGTSLGGTPVLSRCEAAVDHDWGEAAPAPSVPADGFSARWTGTKDFAGGDYTFTARADDGIRVYVDGAVVIDAWRDQSATELRGTKTLAPGLHEVKVEYYDRGWDAVAQVSWAAGGCAAGQVRAEYFGNQTLSGTPAAAACEPAISHDWGAGGPAPGLPADDFSARWTGSHEFSGGDYTFTARADDGIRVYVDGTTVIDAWRDQGATAYHATKTLSRGVHEVVVEYYDSGWDAVAEVSWSGGVAENSPPVPSITGPSPALTYRVGETISFSGSASDAEDGAVPGAGLSWRVLLEHCPGGDCHTHHVTTATGPGGSFTVPDHGDESHFRIELTATDSSGASATRSVSIHPRTVRITLQTSPAGLDVVYDGIRGPAPLTRTSIVGSRHTIAAVSPQNGYVFGSWSDGGAFQHEIVAGTADASYTATMVPGGDTTPPVISGISVSHPSKTSATITWTTNEPADSQVEYGPTSSYETATPRDPALVTRHSVTLTGLSKTTYHFRVVSRDAAGNVARSADQTLRTRR
ncbi:MAG TPA: PQQ-dependent sugar dehydrogenase [Actinomycetota bacterium]|nr:PQQ-dependent sugar dehydrogenase [Actinomycetota bacterium]